jgi:DNA-binding SARP family transcriptional activator/tetratricopeptide (TPR) repeat protein
MDILWGGSPPESARAVVQTRISELRSAIANAGFDHVVPISQHAGSYRLTAQHDCIDAFRFRRVAESWRQIPSLEQARDSLRDALALWRGAVLGGWLSPEGHFSLCRQLEDLRFTALEDVLGLELRLGNHFRVVDEVVDICEANPTRESTVELGMLALTRTGRVAEALRVFDRCRRLLREELGADPSQRLLDLHIQILRGSNTSPEPRASVSPAWDGNVVTPRRLPPDVDGFTGRDNQLREVSELLRRKGRGRAAVVMLSGPAGAGKTALATRAAHIVKDDFPDGHLMADLHGLGEPGSQSPYDILGRFLRAFGIDQLDLPQALAERVDLFRELTFSRRVLVFLDDAASDEQIAPLIPSGAQCAVLVTSRRRIGSTLDVTSIVVSELEPKEAQTLLAKLAGRQRVEAEQGASQEVVRLCGSMPIALRVTGAKLASKPHWTIAKMAALLGGESQRLDHLVHGTLDVRASIMLSCAGLSPEAQRLLRLLPCVSSPMISTWMAAALLDVPIAEAEQHLEALFDAQLVNAAGHDVTGYSRYRMHDLIRVLATELASAAGPGELAQARNRQYGLWLHLCDAVHRTVYGGDYQNIRGDSPRWVLDSRTTGALIAEPKRWIDAELANIKSVVTQAAADSHAASWELVCTMSTLLQMRRHYSDWEEMLNVSLNAAERSQDGRGVAAIQYRTGLLHADRQNYAAGAAALQQAANYFREAGDSHGLGIVTAYSAMIDRFEGNHRVALGRYQSALEALRAAGDIGGEGFVLRSIGQIHLAAGEMDLADAMFEASLRCCRSISSRSGEAQALYWQGMARLESMQHEAAQDAFLTTMAICQRDGDRPGQAQALWGLGLNYVRQGEFRQAASVLTDALSVVTRFPGSSLVEHKIRQVLEQVPAEYLPRSSPQLPG